MLTKITCPVCDRPNVEDSFCPNCETDLSLIRNLMELPTESDSSPSPKLSNWILFLGVGLLVLGILTGIAGEKFIFSTNNTIPDLLSIYPNDINTKEIPKEIPQLKCSQQGFYYIVRKGDSLSLIASRFYGDLEKLDLILKANSQQIKDQNYLEIGDKLFIPNLEENCP